jgi:NTE family protein
MKKSVLVVLLLLLSGCSTLPIHNPESDKLFSEVNSEGKSYDLVFVLGGGGVKGFAHLGVLEEFERANIRPDLMVGCSAGAIVGAMYADNQNTSVLREKLFRAQSGDVLEGFGLLSSRFGYSDGSRLKQYLEKEINAKTFKDLKIPLVVVATDLSDGKLVEIHAGELVPAVRASAAVPGVFEPVQINGKYLIDGGAVDCIPVRTAKKFRPKVVIAIDIGEKLTKNEPTNLFGVMKRAIEISYIHLASHTIKGADIIISMEFKDVGMFDESQKNKLYETGVMKAREAIPKIKQLLSSRAGANH